MTSVRLGFTVGQGDPVDIPLKHMVVCGQTQASGKTTTLEALITRAGLQAVTFVTKRGEASFREARRTQPYFREQADWQYVASVLEASRGEKLKFERAWIIRASKGARTLADVQANIKQALKDPKIRGMSADVYLTLDAYLDVVVPAITRIQWARELVLFPGVNAVDLTDVPDEMQHLVIRSSLDWVLRHEQQTVVVIPEAWKFLPQGRGTPVKLGAEAYIRQGAALGNYLWLDSQDIGGIEKTILRSVIVWILGVQRESNEIKRTLENLPASAPKLTAADISSLEIGQFYACWGRHAIKTYVQPTWLHDLEARAVATGTHPIQRAGGTPAHLAPIDGPRVSRVQEEPSVTKDQADALVAENKDLTGQNNRLTALIADLRLRIEELEKARLETQGAPEPARRRDIMEVVPKEEPARRNTPDQPTGVVDLTDAQYQAIKARLLADADVQGVLLRLQVQRPEIVVEVERKVVTIDTSNTRGRVARLMAQGYFAEPRGVSTVRRELTRTGADPGGGATLYDVCATFTKEGFLVRGAEPNTYQIAPGVQVTERELSVV